jgi:hypothetical protein
VQFRLFITNPARNGSCHFVQSQNCAIIGTVARDMVLRGSKGRMACAIVDYTGYFQMLIYNSRSR